ncbi:transglutaminase-like domain-containing protein [Hymenobacter sp. NST-14]|uniref:transglutaminase-like domain-containing protein n=1 Tax=Hymenobacter piscis TaxID=2839984 RepID=UPI001C00D7F8|nr:transglutaminase-like domain-containing protein [Hymenobacter piscis]MBT9395650.1 transglutaminase-like domain-containing protein [Hymenobacter piscis]
MTAVLLLTGVSAGAQVPTAPLAFSATPDPTVRYQPLTSPYDVAYLTNLRVAYQLDKVISGQQTDLGRVQAVSAWVRRQWKHGQAASPQNDPVAILQAAAQGKHLRCVEYGTVLAGALTALGIPTRTLGLYTADVETRRRGAGHQLAEAWLADQHKWVLVDGQLDAVPLLNGRPLNAVELQRALAEKAPGFAVASTSGTTARRYARFIRPYLYHFSASFTAQPTPKPGAVELILVPVGAKNPVVFQRTYPLAGHCYTHSLASFYAPPR